MEVCILWARGVPSIMCFSTTCAYGGPRLADSGAEVGGELG